MLALIQHPFSVIGHHSVASVSTALSDVTLHCCLALNNLNFLPKVVKHIKQRESIK